MRFSNPNEDVPNSNKILIEFTVLFIESLLPYTPQSNKETEKYK